jgi:nucleotide-binding universal stress UspA family protein
MSIVLGFDESPGARHALAMALNPAADRHDARVIVVGTSGESPLRGAVLGSVPHKLLHLSSRPVLCVPAA